MFGSAAENFQKKADRKLKIPENVRLGS